MATRRDSLLYRGHGALLFACQNYIGRVAGCPPRRKTDAAMTLVIVTTGYAGNTVFRNMMDNTFIVHGQRLTSWTAVSPRLRRCARWGRQARRGLSPSPL